MLGSREIISYAEETSAWGTWANPTVILKNARLTPNTSEDWQEVLQAGGGTIYSTKEVGNSIRRFNLTFNPQDWRMFPFIVGASVLTDADPIFTHNMTGIAVTTESFSLQRLIDATTDAVRKYEGCKVDTATLSWNIGGGGATGKFIELSLDCVAEDVTLGTTGAGTPAAASTAIFQAKSVQVTLATSNVVTECLSGTVVIENNLNDSMYADYASSGLIVEPEPTIRRVHGTLQVYEEDNTFRGYEDGRVVVTGTNTIKFSRGTNDYLLLTFTNIRIKAPDPTVLDGPNIVNIEFDADYVAIEAKDLLSSYPDET